MGVTLTDVLLFGKAQSDDVDNATLVIYRRNILRWSALGGYLDIIVKGVSPLSLPDAIANSLSYVKAYGGTEQRNLPDDYIERQFIYMMDNSYLLTDIIPTYDGHYEMDFQTTTVSSGVKTYIGGRTAGHPAGLRFGTDSSNRWVLGAFGESYTSISPSNNTRYKFVYNNQRASLTSNGTTIFDVTSTGTSATGAELAINALNNNGTIVSGNAEIYLYSFKAWNAQGELVMDLVPAIQKGTVPVVGFYDTVSKTFKTATAGTFAAGGEAVPTPDTPMDIVSNNGVLKYGVLGKNLFNVSANPLEQGGIASNDGQDTSSSYNQRVRTNGYIPVKPSTVYTASVKDLQIYYLEYAQDKTYTDRHATGFSDNSVTITTGANTYFIRLQFRKPDNSNIQPSEVTNVQLERGSTATEYEPYREGIYTDGTVETIGMIAGNIISDDIAGANINSAGKVVSSGKVIHIAPVVPGETYTCDSVGVIAYFTDIPVIGSVSYDGSRVTTTNPTFTVPNDPTIKYVAFSNDTATSYCVQGSVLYSGGTATTEILLKVGNYQDVQSIIDGVVTRNVGVLVLDGTENWSYNTVYSRFQTIIPTMPVASSRTLPFISTHYQVVYGTTTAPGYMYNGPNRQLMLSDAHTSVESWTQWLADQYAAGTPVIVLYPLDEPTTESVAGQTLQVTDGDNVLEITQASLNNLELEAEYKAAVSLTIQEVQDANLDPNVEVTIN